MDEDAVRDELVGLRGASSRLSDAIQALHLVVAERLTRVEENTRQALDDARGLDGRLRILESGERERVSVTWVSKLESQLDDRAAKGSVEKLDERLKMLEQRSWWLAGVSFGVGAVMSKVASWLSLK